MFNNKLGAALLVATLPVAALITAEAANAATAPSASITVRTSDQTPTSGHAFTVSGVLSENTKAAGNHIVKIQALRGDTWQTLPGAHERTNAQGRYQLTLVLDAKGSRILRVVGVGAGTQPTAHQKFSVSVH